MSRADPGSPYSTSETTGVNRLGTAMKNTFPDGPGAFPAIPVPSQCFPGAIPEQKHRGDSGRATKVLNISKLFFERPGASRMPMMIPDHPDVGKVQFPADPGSSRFGILRSRRYGPTVQCDWGISLRSIIITWQVGHCCLSVYVVSKRHPPQRVTG